METQNLLRLHTPKARFGFAAALTKSEQVLNFLSICDIIGRRSKHIYIVALIALLLKGNDELIDAQHSRPSVLDKSPGMVGCLV